MTSKLIAIDFTGLEAISTPRYGGGATFGAIISDSLDIIFPIAGLAALAYLIYGGYMYLTSAGDPKAVQGAMKTITYAIVGFLVLISAFFAANIMGYSLQLGGLNEIF